jgi:hypothetical protein
LQILTHSDQFLDILKIQVIKMFKKLLNVLIQPKIGNYVDAKIWIQKILLKEKYRKINS